MAGAGETGTGEAPPTTRLTLRIWHPDCWTLEATAAVDAGLVAHSVHEFDGLVNARLTAYADRKALVDDLVAEIEACGQTTRVERIHDYVDPNRRPRPVGNATEELLVRYDSATSIHDAFLSRGFIPDEEIRIRDGYEYWTVVVPADRRAVRARLDEVRREMDAEVVVQGTGTPSVAEPPGRTDGLSERQREVFEAARRQGYYSWPRETSATDLADSFDVSKATVLEHLRKAEAKLLDPDG